MPEYQFCKIENLDEDSAEPDVHDASYNPPPEIVPESEANCVISLLEDGHHIPMIDIDFAARLVPSSTPGHFHLYLDGHPMETQAYHKLLTALVEAGVLEPGCFARFERNGYSVLRKPDVKKPSVNSGKKKNDAWDAWEYSL